MPGMLRRLKKHNEKPETDTEIDITPRDQTRNYRDLYRSSSTEKHVATTITYIH